MTSFMKRNGNVVLLLGLINSTPGKNMSGYMVDINVLLYVFCYLFFICFLVAGAYYLSRLERNREEETAFIEDYDGQIRPSTSGFQMRQTTYYNINMPDMRNLEVDRNVRIEALPPYIPGDFIFGPLWHLGSYAVGAILKELRGDGSAGGSNTSHRNTGFRENTTSNNNLLASRNMMANNNAASSRIAPSAPEMPASEIVFSNGNMLAKRLEASISRQSAFNRVSEGNSRDLSSNERYTTFLGILRTDVEEEKNVIIGLLSNTLLLKHLQDTLSTYFDEIEGLEDSINNAENSFYSSTSISAQNEHFNFTMFMASRLLDIINKTIKLLRQQEQHRKLN
jgi:hypothetical protein